MGQKQSGSAKSQQKTRQQAETPENAPNPTGMLHEKERLNSRLIYERRRELRKLFLRLPLGKR